MERRKKGKEMDFDNDPNIIMEIWFIFMNVYSIKYYYFYHFCINIFICIISMQPTHNLDLDLVTPK